MVAQNGCSVYNRLTDAQSQQASMDTLYKGFISKIQDTNMASTATQLGVAQPDPASGGAGRYRSAQPAFAVELFAGFLRRLASFLRFSAGSVKAPPL